MPHKFKPQQMPLQRKDEGKGRLARLTTFGKYYVTYRIIDILTCLHGASKVGEKLHLSFFLQIHNSVHRVLKLKKVTDITRLTKLRTLQDSQEPSPRLHEQGRLYLLEMLTHYEWSSGMKLFVTYAGMGTSRMHSD